MNERISRQLLCIEAVIFLAPVTALTLLYVSGWILLDQHGGLGEKSWQEHAISVFASLGLASQLCGWRLIAAFLTDGRAGIRRVSNFYVYPISVGAVLVTLSGLAILLMTVEPEPPDFVVVFSMNSVALPALIPFLHVMVERQMSRRAGIGRANVSRAAVGSADPRTA